MQQTQKPVEFQNHRIDFLFVRILVCVSPAELKWYLKCRILHLSLFD